MVQTFADQGSEIVSYGWFLHLEQAEDTEKSSLKELSSGKNFPGAAPTITFLGYTVVGTIVNGLIENPDGPIYGNDVFAEDPDRLEADPGVSEDAIRRPIMPLNLYALRKSGRVHLSLTLDDYAPAWTSRQHGMKGATMT